MGQNARVIQVIETDDLRGKGTPEEPYVRVRQYFTTDGKLIAEYKPPAPAPAQAAAAPPAASPPVKKGAKAKPAAPPAA